VRTPCGATSSAAADLATASALAAPDQQRAHDLVEIAFGERERFLDAATRLAT
jgi:hypothetical protein